MNGVRAPGDRILGSKGFEKLCRAVGINAYQYRQLLGLFSTLSNRLEFMGTTADLNKMIAGYVLMSVFMSLTIFTNPPLPAYLSLMILYTMFLIALSVFMDAANSIMNPDEASVLAHQPIEGATYIAAKMSHVLAAVAIFVPCMNLIPSIVGLYLSGAQWFYPLTHMLAAYLSGLFVAFLICGIYGWLVRFVSPSKLKSAALWLQLIAFVGFMLMSNLFQLFRIKGAWVARILSSSWMPWRWFVAIGLWGNAKYPGFSIWQAAAAGLATIAFILFGLRGFKMDYMGAVASLLQGSASSKIKPARRSWLNPLVRKLTGSPSGYGAFAFVSIMFRRDWNFRRQAIVPALYLPIAIGAIVKGIRTSPFVHGSSMRDFPLMHLFPHVIGVFFVVLCSLISYTAEPKGATMFVSLPFEHPRAFVRGIYLSVWAPTAILFLILLAPCTWFWGWMPAGLFIGFSLALASLYLALGIFLVDGFPFANAIKPSMANAQPLILFGALIPIGIFAGIQWFVFHNAFMVVAAAIILTGLAYVAAHFSLKKLEKKCRENLVFLGYGPSQMFKELE
jgi:hypothetical protein